MATMQGWRAGATGVLTTIGLGWGGAAVARPAPDDVTGALARTVQRVVEQVRASVVRIEVKRTSAPAEATPKHPPTGNPLAFPAPGTPSAYFQRPEGGTSAVVVDADGGLVTAYYNVSERVESITVVLPDGRHLPATVVGADPNSDIAYLRVDATGLTPIRFAAAEPRVGQLVVALGCTPDEHAGGAPTATVGIVSATHRLRGTAPEGERRGSALQVSARLNYGNNGGPIVDMDGALVAVAAHTTHDQTNPDARKGFNSGVGFATPTARLQALLPRLRAGETLPERESPFLGVGALGPDPKGEGVRVGQIVPNTPAAASGLRVGDIIVIAGETQVESGIDLRAAILERDVGDPLELVVLRGPERVRMELTVTLGARPTQPRRR